ncbi:MAG: PAS domain S-box protein [Candidatus Omnitrophica bacterium]|nr:PAS domain S-box protein [Candidatus Omnitrophota bacterium]
MAKKRTMPRAKDGEFPIVAIGASAGGLEAFSELLKNLPPDTGMAFVLVCHLAPMHKSMLTEIITRITRMPTQEVKNRMPVYPDHVYIIPPNKKMTISNGKFRLGLRTETLGLYLPIDCFFTSLAKDRGSQAIGVILSGAASDGINGQKAIKSMGGITFSQDPATAKQDSMPKGAIASGFVDYVLNPKAIAGQLVSLSQHLPLIKTKTKGLEKLLLSAQDDLTKILVLLKYFNGVDFTHYKKATIERRIKRRLLLTQKSTLKEYLKYLRRNPKEVELLFQDMLINVTNFFRDPKLFKALEKKVFPNIFKQKPPDQAVRIWVPACSTGEEAYSLAICLLEILKSKKRSWPIQVFATDVNEAVIRKARRGLYPESIKEDVPPQILHRYFVKEPGGWRVVKSVRDICVFAAQDLTRDPPFSKLDLISCRNMLIYMDRKLQKKIISLFHYGLNPSGSLVLGSAESIFGFTDLFSAVDKRLKIYRKKESWARPAVYFEPGQYPVGQITTGNERTAAYKKQPIAFEMQAEDVQAKDEELRSALEEIQSANEELQSSNEELETSKEELQASNEEMVTLNDELSVRNAELGKLNSDIRNLFNSTHIPVIMVGRDFCIYRFTPMAQKVWNLIPSDVGRKLKDINPNIHVPHLEVMLVDAIDHLKMTEKEVQDNEGHWYCVTVRPYKTVDNKIDGAVIVLSDIHTIKLAGRQIEALGEYFENIVKAVPDPLIVLDKNLCVRTANQSFYDQFKVSPKQTEGHLLYDLGNHQWDLPALRKLLKEVYANNVPVNDFEMSHKFPRIGQKVMLLNARIVVENIAGERLILLSIKDITERKETEKNIVRLSSFPEINPNPIYEVDFKGKITYANLAAKELKADGLAPLIENGLKELVDIFRRNRKKEILREFQAADRWYLQSLYKVPDIDALRIYNIDITERKRAQDALQVSRERLELALLSSRMATFDWDIIRNKRTWSEGVHKLLGTKSETFTGSAEEFFRIIHPEDRSFVQAAISKAIETGIYETEYRALWPDGSCHNIAARGNVHHDNAGRAVSMTGVCWDITENKQVENALQESEELYHSLFENMLNGFAYCQMYFDDKGSPVDFTYLSVNTAFERLTGLKDVIGKKVTQVIPGLRESDPGVFEIYGRVSKTGKPESIEIFVNALQMWFEISVYSPKRGYFVAVFDVVTARKEAEKQMKDTINYVQTILSASPIAILTFKATGENVSANQAAAKLIGTSVESLNKQNFYQLDSWKNSGLLERATRVLKTRQEEVFEAHFTSSFGSPIWIAGRLASFQIGGQPHLLLMAVDISERKRVEDILRKSEEQYRELVQNANSAIIRWKVDGTIAFFNEYAQDLFGWRADEVIGKHVNIIVPSQDSTGADLKNLVLDIARHPENYVHSVNENICRDGRRVWMAWTNKPMFDENGMVTEILAVGFDNSALKESEIKLREREEQLKLFVDYAPASIAMFDTQMRYITASQRWLADYGLSGQDLRGRSHYEVFPEIPERWKEIHRRCMAGIVERAEEDQFDRLDGHKQWVRWEIRPWYTALGSVGGIIIFLEDTTERKLAQDMLKQAKLKAEDANRSKSEFLAHVAHDLRTPLNAIVGFCSLLTSESAADKRPRMIEVIRIQSQNILTLINEILDAARLESHKITLRNEGFDLKATVDMAVELLRLEAGSKDVKISYSYDQNIPRIKGDAIRVAQILNNLLSNALKYTEQGEITFIVDLVSAGTDKKKCHIKFFIKDTGWGIPQEKLSAIFDPFVRAHEFVGDKDMAGVGLGLYICKLLVHLMGGQISVESQEGKGTTFVFDLNFETAAQ